MPDLSPAESSTNSNTFPNETSYALNDFFAPEFGSEDPTLHLSSPAVAKAVDFYFQYCHRQPIWCFNYEDLEEMGFLPKELVYSILTLTARFSRAQDQLQFYSDTARTLIMLRVASGTVDLETIESLCLLAYSFFMDGNIYLGQFHLGFAFQLCLSGMIDVEASAPAENALAQRKKRVFWSLLTLEQSYGHPNGLLRVSAEIICPCCVPYKADDEPQNENEPRRSPLPRNEMSSSRTADIDIWSLTAHFGWVWSKVRTYVSDCAQNKLKEPWRHDSMYSLILSEVTEAENKLSQYHRYDSVKFYERKADEVRINRGYWGPWLKLQFMYHCILGMVNHPFLYIVASQHNADLAIPNAFWRRSTELALLHATWIVRMIDMVTDKKMRLSDPFFGHAAAVAATVHLYYCRAADPRLKFKSKTDVAKCRKFLENFVSFSPACQVLVCRTTTLNIHTDIHSNEIHDKDQTLEKILHIAFQSENVDFDWTPSRMYLSVSLMWDVLRANCTPNGQDNSTTGLLHRSLIPTVTREDSVQSSSTLEIVVASSPEVTVNTADGGQTAHMPPKVRSGTTPAAPFSPGGIDLEDTLVVPNDDLMLNTPWLWSDPTNWTETDNSMNRQRVDNNMDGVYTWWDLGNL